MIGQQFSRHENRSSQFDPLHRERDDTIPDARDQQPPDDPWVQEAKNKTSFLTQVTYMVKRIWIIKARVKKNIITEMLWPLFFIIILALIKYIANVSTVNGGAIPSYPQQSIFQKKLTGSIIVVPSNKTTFVEQAISQHLPANSLITLGLDSEIEAHNHYVNTQGNQIYAGVTFVNDSFNHYIIRTDFSESADAYSTINEIDQCRPTSISCPSQFYLTSGFLSLQYALDSAILESEGVSLYNVSVEQMGKNSFIPDSQFIRQFAPVAYVYIYSFLIQFLVINLVTEKCRKMKEMLRIMGMTETAFWMSWSIVYWGLIIFISTAAVIFARVTSFLRPPSNFLVFFLMLMLYGLTVINFAFAITPFLNNPQVAGPVSILSTTAVSSMFMIVSFNTHYDANGNPTSTLPVAVQWLLCLLSPTALGVAIERAIYLDVSQIGLTWSSLHIGDFPLYAPFIMLSIDAILYLILAIWLENVVPGAYGQSRTLCFCFTSKYWKKKSDKTDSTKVEAEFSDSPQNCEHIEPVPEDLHGKNHLRLFSLEKIYKSSGGGIHALKGVSLDIYENEITCILGHNGAGKTSMMNILTGLTLPTSGTALIYGLDIRDPVDMTRIRKLTGLCPQHDVLVENMTVKEHLELYASLKGVNTTSSIQQEVMSILRDVDLLDKADCYSKNLSGGQKRKLSVGIAFIGNPKVVFLDEPSAGMDPKSRRHLWQLLKNKKQSRIIVLTTHFMDEADILADRKAIISRGKLRCCGTSIYLKTKFGIGYNLNLVVHPTDYKKEDVENMVSHNVPGAKVAHSHGMEVCFSLPLEQVSFFPDLFSRLEEPVSDENKTKRAALLGIMSYGISMTTLEEVFLRLAEIAEAESESGDNQDLTQIAEPKVKKKKTTIFSLGSRRSQAQNESKTSIANASLPDLLKPFEELPPPNAAQVFKELVKIRLLLALRDKMALFSRIILPAILGFVGVLMLKISKLDYNPPLLTIQHDIETSFAGFRNDYAIYDTETPSEWNKTIHNLTELPSVDLDMRSTSVLILQPLMFAVRFKQSDITKNISLTLLYNDTWLHSLPTVINIITNSILSRNDINTLVRVESKAWPSITPRVVFSSPIFIFGLMIGFATIFLPSSFAQQAVYDRVGKAKSQLRIAGVSTKMYWCTVMVADYLQYFFVAFVMVLTFFIVQLRPLIEPGALLCTIIYILLYIPIFMLFFYILSYMFESPDTSQGLIQTIGIILNICFYVPVAIAGLTDNFITRDIADTMHVVFVFINPCYSASGFFLYLLRFDVTQSYTQQSSDPIIVLASYWKWKNKISVVLIAGVWWLILLVLILRIADVLKAGRSVRSIFLSDETQPQGSKVNTHVIRDEDEDVAEERALANQTSVTKSKKFSSLSNQEPVLRVQELHKHFKKKTERDLAETHIAVKNLSFKVMPGEVLGLLGPNGAGKSTTMNMLTAELSPDAGEVRIGATDIHYNLKTAYKTMGYCPQFDAVWPTITVKEHLKVYAVIRGYHPQAAPIVTDYFINLLKLEEHALKQTRMLSGGTKRKLSFAMAMLGDSKIVLLDEPSTGMDPQSKRVFWDAIKYSFKSAQRGAILTTHYMEEADALCHRIAIMINGQLECIGTPQHLKTRFGHGYQLEVKLIPKTRSSMMEEIEDLHDFIYHHFPNSHILEQFGHRVQYKIALSDVRSLAESFEILELAKRVLSIGEYNFSQATLEQVFLEFAKHQTERSNNSDERQARTQEMAKTRKVSQLHSKGNSTTILTLTSDKDIRLLDRKLSSALEKYADDNMKAPSSDKTDSKHAPSSTGSHSSGITEKLKARTSLKQRAPPPKKDAVLYSKQRKLTTITSHSRESFNLESDDDMKEVTEGTATTNGTTEGRFHPSNEVNKKL